MYTNKIIITRLEGYENTQNYLNKNINQVA